MKTVERVKAAKLLIEDIESGELYRFLQRQCVDEHGYSDYEDYEYYLEQIIDHIKFVLDTENNTLPSLDRLRELAERDKLI